MNNRMPIRTWLTTIIFLLAMVCSSLARQVIYVDIDAIGLNNGSSWTNAYNYLQDALTTARMSEVEKPLEIRVAQGTYKPNEGLLPIVAPRPPFGGIPQPGVWPTDEGHLASFDLLNGVTIKGGYAGVNESDPNARDVKLYESILSGDLNVDDIEADDPCDLLEEPTRRDNSMHVIVSVHNDANAIMDGFTVTGGQDESTALGGWTGGAGIILRQSNPTLIDCTFTRNIVLEVGGGMYNMSSDPTLINCVFAENYAEWGAGIYNGTSRQTQEHSNPRLINCTFTSNYARWIGGGIYNEGGNSSLLNCTFIRNSAGGFCGGGNPEFVDCEFIQNNDGGIYSLGSPRLTNCIFSNNSTKYYGGGMSSEGTYGIILTNCIFSGNSAGRSGGGLLGRDLVLNNCIFTGNKVYGEESHLGKGGGCVIFGDNTTMTNCTFYGNWARQGRAIFKSSDTVLRVENCILWDGGNEISRNDPSNSAVSYSNIQGSWEGEGNIDIDPCFADPGYWADADDSNIVAEPNNPNAVWIEGDYHLKSQAGRWDPNSQSWVQDDVTSPCIDAGDPNSPIGHEPFPNGGIINMGTYGGTAEASKSPSGLHAKYGGGTGEPNNPYLIYTAEHMNTIGLQEQDWDKHFKLMADIDLAGYSYLQALIAPDVDTDEYYFQGNPYVGIFDGNGHTISNLTITGVSYLGLFGELAFGAEVKDLGVVDVNIIGSGDIAGGLLGHSRSGATIIRCYSTGTVNGDDNIGGLVGSNGGHVRYCYSNSTVSGNYIVGGLLGANEGQAEVTNCYSTGVVKGDDAVGGLVGFNLGKLTHCYSAGAVTGSQRVGGIVGWIYGSIVSSLWDIEASGQVNMCGSQEEGASGCDDSFGKITVEMQTADTFLEAGWDFVDESVNGTEDIWWILEGQDYPRFLEETY